MDRFHTRATGRGPASTFTGDVYITPMAIPEPPSRLFAALVRFAPGARSHWHSHAAGQTLYVTEGVGLVGTRDGTVLRILPGDTVWSPPGEEHWHGATGNTLMCHVAMLEMNDDGSDPTTWLEPVTDAEYRAAPAE